MSLKKNVYGSKNSVLVLFLFSVILLFQITVFKFTLNLEIVSRILNFIFLFTLVILVPKAIINNRNSINITLFYLAPAVLMVLGISLNIGINIYRDFSNFGFLANLSPWLMYISIPTFLDAKQLNTEKLWEYYYKFMLVTTILSLSEYLLVTEFGLMNLKFVTIQYGNFLLGYFTVLYPNGDGSAYYRFYGSFIEPGTYAMYLLPVIVYSFILKKRIATVIFVIALFYTASLGGIASLAIAVVLLLFTSVNTGRNTKLIAISVLLISALLGYFFLDEYFTQAYKDKNVSREIRENNVSNFFEKLPSLILETPFGIELNDDTEELERINTNYTGYNFTPGNQFQYGGILAFVGYCFVLLSTVFISFFNIFKKKLDNESKIVLISVIVLFPFIFQRMVILDTCLYGLLFSPVFIRTLKSYVII